MKSKNLIIIILGLASLNSCSKEGTGGNAKISGTVYEQLIDKNGKTVESRLAQDKKIYIKYGSNNSYNDDTETLADGTYEFSYLTKGEYSIYTYSECDTCSTENEIIEHPLTISSRNELITKDLNTNKFVNPDDGNSIIKGRILIQRYLGATPFGEPFVAQNLDVFIKYDTDEIHFDKTETGADGQFAFRDLIIGNYTVYAYSICDTCNVLFETVESNTEILSNGSSVNIGDIIVETP